MIALITTVAQEVEYDPYTGGYTDGGKGAAFIGGVIVALFIAWLLSR